MTCLLDPLLVELRELEQRGLVGQSDAAKLELEAHRARRHEAVHPSRVRVAHRLEGVLLLRDGRGPLRLPLGLAAAQEARELIDLELVGVVGVERTPERLEGARGELRARQADLLARDGLELVEGDEARVVLVDLLEEIIVACRGGLERDVPRPLETLVERAGERDLLVGAR